MKTEAAEALAAWTRDLGSWAIPHEILDRAAASPWTPERSVFIRRAAAQKAAPRGHSYRLAREALAPGGSVLDVGAGAGAASLPHLARAGTLIAVDGDDELLRQLVAQAAPEQQKVTRVIGTWPSVAAGIPSCDIVVCHHVLYNVAELAPFVEALHDHARRRVVIEITAHHPLSRLNPLWKRFHDLSRPTRPTWEDAVRAIEAVRGPVHVERERLPSDRLSDDWDDLATFTCRRLCLPADQKAEVAAAMTELLGATPDDPSTWSAANRDIATIWWDVTDGVGT